MTSNVCSLKWVKVGFRVMLKYFEPAKTAVLRSRSEWRFGLGAKKDGCFRRLKYFEIEKSLSVVVYFVVI